MGNGLAVLAGLGKAFQGLPEGYIAGQKLDQGQQQLDELAAFRKQQSENQTTDIGQLFSAIGLPMPAGLSGRVPNTVATLAATRAQGDAERQRLLGERERLAGDLERLGAPTAPRPTGTLAPGEDPEAAAFIGATPGAPGDPRLAAAAKFARAGAGLDSLWKQLYPDHDKPLVVGADASVYEPGKGFVPSPNAGKPKIELRPGAGDTFAIPVDRVSGEPGAPVPVGIGSPESKGVYTRADIEEQLKLEGLQPGSLQYRTRYNDLARQIAIAPGGAIYGPGSGLTGATPTPGQPGAPLASRPAMPNPGEREDLASLDAADTQIQQVLAALRSGKLKGVTGGMFKNTGGAMARTTEKYLGYGLTDEQRQLVGTLEIQLQAIKHALIGATRTRPELADLAAAIPDTKDLLTADTDTQMIPKLEATLADLRTKRGARENVMGSTGVAVPARPPAPQTPPQAPIWILRDRNGRERRYQPDPGETQPPAGYTRVR